MREGQSIKTIRGKGSPIKSPLLGAVSAALTTGIQFSSNDCLLHTIREVDGEALEEFAFTFDGDSTCTFEPSFARETIDLHELAKRFQSDEWCKANPHHPIAYMRTILDHRNSLVAQIKNRPRHEVIEVKTGSRTSRCYIPENATAEEREAILKDFHET